MNRLSLTLELQSPTTFAIRSGGSALHCLLEMQNFASCICAAVRWEGLFLQG